MNSQPAIRRKPLTGWFTEKDVDRIIDVAGGAPTTTERFAVEVPNLEKGILETRHFDARRAIRVLLNQAADRWDFEARRRKRPTDANLLRGLERVQKSAKVLHDALSPVAQERRSNMVLQKEVLFQLSLIAERLAPEIAPYPIQPSPWGQDANCDPIKTLIGDDQLRADVEAVRRLLLWADAAVAFSQSCDDTRKWSDLREDRAMIFLFNDLLQIWTKILGRERKTSVSSMSGTPGGPTIHFVQECLQPLGLEMTENAIRDRIREHNPRRVRKGTNSETR